MFNNTTPFSLNSYNILFTHYIDLAVFDDNQWPILTVNGVSIFNGYLPLDAGSCGRDKQVKMGYHSLLTKRINRSYTYLNARSVFLEDFSGDILFHEFGHSFGRLTDEYVESAVPPYLADSPAGKVFMAIMGVSFKRNCSTDPKIDFSYGGKSYGGTFEGCWFDYVNGKKVYRSSADSVMRQDGLYKFNAISCGYILKAIKGGRAKSYWPECATMPGIIPVGL